MKKVINGRKYDTDTARCVFVHYNTPDVRDFNYACTSLYRKQTGEFFFHGEGGPLSCYATHFGNMSSGGQLIRPATDDEARKFVEKYGDADDYEGIFGAVEE